MTVTSLAYAETFRQLRIRLQQKPEEERNREQVEGDETNFQIDQVPAPVTSPQASLSKLCSMKILKEHANDMSLYMRPV